MRIAKHACEKVDGAELTLMASSQNTHQDSLVVCSTSRSVAGARLAIDHGGANRLLSRPVGSLHLRALQENEQLFFMVSQVLGQALVGRVGLLLDQQTPHASLQMTLGNPHAPRADLFGVPAIPHRQGRLQKVFHLSRKLGSRARGHLLQVSAAPQQVSQTGLARGMGKPTVGSPTIRADQPRIVLSQHIGRFLIAAALCDPVHRLLRRHKDPQPRLCPPMRHPVSSGYTTRDPRTFSTNFS